MKSFASDNNSGVHPLVLTSIENINSGFVKSYGDDDYTKSVIEKFKTLFKCEVDIFFVLNGTAANVTALGAVTNSYHSIIAAETSHINVDECGA